MFSQNHSMALAVLTAAATLNAGAGLTPARAQCELAKLLASDGAEGDYFGYGLAVSGYMAIITAYGDDDNGELSGSAYDFPYDGLDWVEEAKLVPSGSDLQGDCFGWSAAISGDIAVIGTMHRGNNYYLSGWAYVFRYDGSNWLQEAKLLGSDAAGDDYFAHSVAVFGNTALIGAARGGGAGWVYVFRYDGSSWVEEQKLLASDGADGDGFGWGMAISGDIAVIGAHDNDDNGEGSGSAYVFRYDGSAWVEEQKLLPFDGVVGDGFGLDVAISGDTALIGAWGDDDNGEDSGSAYVFRYDGSSWVEEQKLLAFDGAAGDGFGWGMAISGDTAVIGASTDDDNGEDSGSAYVFRYDGSSWVPQAKLLASDGAAADWFGWPVAISGDMGMIGAYQYSSGGPGSVYVFSLTGVDCNENGVCDGRDIAEGTSEDCQPNGVPDECDIASGTSDDDNDNGVPDECDAPIPTVSEWGMVAMALLVLTAGTIVLTGRRPKGNVGSG